MNTIALQCAGLLAILAAVGHGYLGDRALSTQPIEPLRMKNFIRFCYQFGSLGWLVGGVLLLFVPSIVEKGAQVWLVLPIILLYGVGACVNAWFTQGRHLGWVILVAIVGLALIGIW
ncbi:MAG: hypothetical protein AAF702_30085 [Chloroflexota bacterium]